jgi:predicted PurR-regulated permease PerM
VYAAAEGMAASRPPSAPPSPESDGLGPSTPAETRALGFLALVALGALFWVASPVGVGLLLGAMEAFALQSLYERLREHWQPRASALTLSLGAVVLLAVGLSGLGYLLVWRGLALASELPAAFGPGGSLRALADSAATLLAQFHVNPGELISTLEHRAMSLGSRAAALAANVASFTFGALLTIFFMTMTTYFVLRHWTELVTRAELGLPFHRRFTRNLFDRFRVAGRQVFLGTVSTGLVQGVLAGVGYWWTGAPEPAFLGALTAVVSLVPAVGTPLVWVPVGIVRIATGHPAAGVLELIWGALVVVVLCDYVIRPKLLGEEKEVPALLTFVGLLGGVEAFGLVGLLLGPIIVTLAVAVLRAYQEEVAAMRGASFEAPEPSPPPCLPPPG